MTLRETQSLFVFNMSKWITFVYSQGFELTEGEGWRPPEMQKIYFDTGRSKTMEGAHPKRLAHDFNFFLNGKMLFASGISNEQYIRDLELVRPLGEFWESLNTSNIWGGDFNKNNIFEPFEFRDPFHIQMS